MHSGSMCAALSHGMPNGADWIQDNGTAGTEVQEPEEEGRHCLNHKTMEPLVHKAR